MFSLVSKLKALKSKVIRWERIKKRALKEQLFLIEGELDGIILKNSIGILSDKDMARVKDLDDSKMEILKNKK